ncbi:unnamed protein product [Schistosoma margrebowiei]|uniref:Uncharacterized protein n=1 Tax=Schistosoma margrebowiei TaxID=48269 RepID=A0A3P7YY56_9TREM|nr:unnamed protein product [Schistosoma margrebowiei]
MFYHFLFQAEFRAYNGHSSHVTNVTFLYDGSRLISIGGKDTAVLQWEAYRDLILNAFIVCIFNNNNDDDNEVEEEKEIFLSVAFCSFSS